MAAVVYTLCAATSVICAGLLVRAWLRTRVALLLWCTLCFVGLALNNVLLLVDKLVVTGSDLSVWRTLPAALGLVALVYGLVWKADE